VPSIAKQIFERHQSVAASEPNADAKARLIRTTKHPGVGSGQRVSPQRLLAGIEERI
jgi:hypothetical protein